MIILKFFACPALSHGEMTSPPIVYQANLKSVCKFNVTRLYLIIILLCKYRSWALDNNSIEIIAHKSQRSNSKLFKDRSNFYTLFCKKLNKDLFSHQMLLIYQRMFLSLKSSLL